MPQFASPEELTAKLGGLFQDAVTDEALFQRLQKLDGIVRLQLKDPAAQITVKAKAGEPGVVDVGPSKLNPDVIVRLDGDTAHGWFSGELNPTVALSKGQLRATGAVDKILRLVPLAPALTEQYKAVLEHGGRLTEAPAEPEPEAPAETAEAPAEGPEVTTEAAAEGEPTATEEPVAEEVVEQAPEAPAPGADEEPAVAEAPAGEPEVVDAIGAEAEEPAASEAPAEEPEAPAEAPATSEEAPATSEEAPAASEEAPAASADAPAASADAPAASADAPAASEEAPQPDPAPEDEAPAQS